MVWDFIDVDIMNRTLRGHLEIRNFSSTVISRVSAANHTKPRDLDVKMMYFEVGQSHFDPNHFECYQIVSVGNFRDLSLDLVFDRKRSG